MDLALLTLVTLACSFSVALGQGLPGLPGSPPSAADIIRQLGLLVTLVQNVDMSIPVEAPVTNQVSITVLMKNDLPVPMQITGLRGTAGLNGQTLATFAQSFDNLNFTIPALGDTAMTPIVQPVNLTQGVVPLLLVIPSAALDVQLTLNITVLQVLGINILAVPNFPYIQFAAPATYHLELCSSVEMHPEFELETAMTGGSQVERKRAVVLYETVENRSNTVFLAADMPLFFSSRGMRAYASVFVTATPVARLSFNMHLALLMLVVLAWGFSVALGQGLPGLPDGAEIVDLVQDLDIPIPVEALVTNQVSMTILMKNNLPLPMQITGLRGTAGLNGQTLITFAQSFDNSNFTIPASGGTATTVIQPVDLTQGVLPLLFVIPSAALDVQLTLNITVLQILGIPILPFINFAYTQLAAPTTYHLELCSSVEKQPEFELESEVQ
ncbi:hypothetical protein EXIGLDRAFT_744520 [Exidia glandulosa HHB12029]|uniref:Uncharacterized protein n=1 Tax=Exidia glandulosa HHB12029 TaxID=1314781 RepID=A0A165PUS5_EXIGL|nr:hypothetical protein EXIGLDRAFT_744520 [Exidia glandulosa HHB12029]